MKLSIQEAGKRKSKASCLEKEQDKVVDNGMATDGKKRAVPSLDRVGEQHQHVDQSPLSTSVDNGEVTKANYLRRQKNVPAWPIRPV